MKKNLLVIFTVLFMISCCAFGGIKCDARSNQVQKQINLNNIAHATFTALSSNNKVEYDGSGSKIQVAQGYSVGDGYPLNSIMNYLMNYSKNGNSVFTLKDHTVMYFADRAFTKEDRVYFDYEFTSPYGFYITSHMVKQYFYFGDWVPSIESHDAYSDYSLSSLEKTSWSGVADVSKVRNYIDLYNADRETYELLSGSGVDEVPFTVIFKNTNTLKEKMDTFGADKGTGFKTQKPIADISFEICGKTFWARDITLRDMDFNAYTGTLRFDVNDEQMTGGAFVFNICGNDWQNNVDNPILPTRSTDSTKKNSSGYDIGETDNSDKGAKSNEAIETTASEYVVDGSDSGYFDKAYFEKMTDEELRLARNEIFARHGRKFNSEELQAYFDSKSWYTPKYSPEEFDALGDSILNQWEIANRDLIIEVEKSRK